MLHEGSDEEELDIMMSLDMVEDVVCEISMDFLSMLTELSHIPDKEEDTMRRGKGED